MTTATKAKSLNHVVSKPENEPEYKIHALNCHLGTNKVFWIDLNWTSVVPLKLCKSTILSKLKFVKYKL